MSGMKIHPNLFEAIKYAERRILDTSYPITTEKWQGMEAPQEMRETLLVSLQAVMSDNLSEIAREVKPNQEWADEHFLERVGGKPINPGESYKKWPFASYSAKSLSEGKQPKFNHNYMERIWPKFANNPGMGNYEEGTGGNPIRKGIRYEYGDLRDVVNLLHREPLTRQAYVPIWFPEDTGVNFGGRVPCTLGYHFIRRGNHLHVVYYIRSCDFVRHFRDDIYLAVRKVMWLIGELINLDKEKWIDVKPGIFTMHITSLHCFSSDYAILKKNDHRRKTDNQG